MAQFLLDSDSKMINRHTGSHESTGQLNTGSRSIEAQHSMGGKKSRCEWNTLPFAPFFFLPRGCHHNTTPKLLPVSRTGSLVYDVFGLVQDAIITDAVKYLGLVKGFRGLSTAVPAPR